MPYYRNAPFRIGFSFQKLEIWGLITLNYPLITSQLFSGMPYYRNVPFKTGFSFQKLEVWGLINVNYTLITPNYLQIIFIVKPVCLTIEMYHLK